MSISRIYLFGSHVHCFFLLLLLFAFRSSNGESTEGNSQALQGIIPQSLKGSKGTGSSGSGSAAGLGAGADLAGATEGAVVSAVSSVSILYFFALQWSQSRRTGCTAQGCRYAKTENLCYQKVRTGFHC